MKLITLKQQAVSIKKKQKKTCRLPHNLPADNEVFLLIYHPVKYSWGAKQNFGATDSGYGSKMWTALTWQRALPQSAAENIIVLFVLAPGEKKKICQNSFSVLQLRGNTMNFMRLIVTVYQYQNPFQFCSKIMTHGERSLRLQQLRTIEGETYRACCECFTDFTYLGVLPKHKHYFSMIIRPFAIPHTAFCSL